VIQVIQSESVIHPESLGSPDFFYTIKVIKVFNDLNDLND